ncbi:MAG TPA: hypothetical protein PLV35_00080 [Candidatus Paceibacterota bacterium]|nr:hypothetical protein [Candidatus Paceibacterota bacterium]
MLSVENISNILISNLSIIYLLILLGGFIEGQMIAITTGVLASFGVLNIFVAFGFLLLGCALKSITGYCVGSHLNKRFSKSRIFRKTERNINNLFPLFLKKPFVSMFLARFLVLGLYFLTEVYAGYKKMDKKTFVRAEFLSYLAWSIPTLAMGYFFGYTAVSISGDIKKIILILIVFVVAFIILRKSITYFIRFITKRKSNYEII